MSVRYDVDEMIRRMQASDAAVVLPPDASQEFVVIHRNRFVQHAITRALLEEENNGTPVPILTYMLAHFIAEQLENLASTFQPDIGNALVWAFCQNLEEIFQHLRRPGEPGAITTQVPVPEMQGGHG